MPEEKKVVNLNEEPAPQIDRTPQVTEQPKTVEQQTEPSQSTETTTPTNDQPITTDLPVNADVDEFGVSWKNRAMEWKRKSEELSDRIPQIIEDKLKTIQTQPQQPQYTYEQLEAYKLQNVTDANAVAWATSEQRKIQAADTRKQFEEVVGQREKIRDFEVGRERAYNEVKNKYPDALNPQHPMSNYVRQYMQSPELANRPDGLFIAAKLARADYLDSQTPILQKKTEQLKSEVKQAQHASLTEGAGRRQTITESPVQIATERLKKTGSVRDAEAAVGAILRNRGMLE